MNNTIYQVSIDPENELILYKPYGISIYDPHKFDNFSTGKDQAHSFAVNLDEVRMDSLDLDTERIKR